MADHPYKCTQQSEMALKEITWAHSVPGTGANFFSFIAKALSLPEALLFPIVGWGALTHTYLEMQATLTMSMPCSASGAIGKDKG